ncbi:hypothetical protein PVAND_003948 [Polypedilum vanderplanki]|uniref:Uncharacterized protein n=1 Tax=Polypedilum vanderplanki TaxID=319348 RepID=A0A9J6BVL8_POLVA|nr:hypothetical protein PVAND_003948 [Polypedilum vanderplanki]
MHHSIDDIRIPLAYDSIVTVNQSLRALSSFAAPRVRIYEKEINFMHHSEALNYMSYWSENSVNEYGLVTCLKNVGRASIPSFVQIACRPTLKNLEEDWHVMVVGRIHNIAIIYEPNYDEEFADRVNNLEGSVKIREVLRMFNLKQKMRTKVRIYIGGGGNFNGECRGYSFNFLRNFTKRYLRSPNDAEIDEKFVFENVPYKEISW